MNLDIFVCLFRLGEDLDYYLLSLEHLESIIRFLHFIFVWNSVGFHGWVQNPFYLIKDY